MNTRESRADIDRHFQGGLQAELEGHEPGVVGNPARWRRRRLQRALEQLLGPVRDIAAIDVELIAVPSRRGTTARVELRIGGPCGAGTLRALRRTLKGLTRPRTS